MKKWIVSISVVLLIGIGILVYLVFPDSHYLRAPDSISVTQSELSNCSGKNDCEIYSYTSCGCSRNVSVNKKYIDTEELNNEFPVKDGAECVATCGISKPPENLEVACVEGKCAVKYWF